MPRGVRNTTETLEPVESVEPTEVKEPVREVSEAEYRAQERDFRKVLEKQEKHRVRLPKDSLSKDTRLPVTINGVTTWVEIGKEQEVPDSVYHALIDAGII